MRYKVIWCIVGMIVLWMTVMGGTIALDFDRVQQSNQATAELEWTFICDGDDGEYVEIDIIDGGESFIGRTRDDMENTVIDAKGRALSDTYDSLAILEENADGKEGTGEVTRDVAEADRSHVAKGDRKYVGIRDGAGNWIVPPAFDEIKLTDDGKYAVIRNGANIGIAVLGK